MSDDFGTGETTAACVDFVVADAVAPNRSPSSPSLGNQEKHTASAFLETFKGPKMPVVWPITSLFQCVSLEATRSDQ
jgi:hypothetical protein